MTAIEKKQKTRRRDMDCFIAIPFITVFLLSKINIIQYFP
jgi:hypothetical protein